MTAILSTRDVPTASRVRRETCVLRIGNWRASEFAAVEALARAPTVITIGEACTLLCTLAIAPELILIAQPRPGDVCQPDVDRLQRLAPLTRIVVVAGTWCEGELRTGRPPTGVVRIYWYELASWWQAAERRVAAGLSPAWSASLDHPQAGRYVVECQPSDLPPTAIHADDYSVFESFVDAGVPAIWTRGEIAADAKAGIFDAGQLSERERERLQAFCRKVDGPVIVLVDFPRGEHFVEALSLGASAVFAKPYIVDEVCGALRARHSVRIPGSPHY